MYQVNWFLYLNGMVTHKHCSKYLYVSIIIVYTTNAHSHTHTHVVSALIKVPEKTFSYNDGSEW